MMSLSGIGKEDIPNLFFIVILFHFKYNTSVLKVGRPLPKSILQKGKIIV